MRCSGCYSGCLLDIRVTTLLAVTVNVLKEYVLEVRALEAKLQRRERRKRGPAP
jgi:cell division protein ZapA (FtsZ GTPase activity inhibitor)